MDQKSRTEKAFLATCLVVRGYAVEPRGHTPGFVLSEVAVLAPTHLDPIRLCAVGREVPVVNHAEVCAQGAHCVAGIQPDTQE